jgi:outer membrane protein OmpA-like peptidoglycan-associated protein
MMGIVLFLSVLVGCARMGLEYAPKREYLYYHRELPAAERAVEAARKAGKDQECPEEFKAVAKMKDAAYETYWACRTNEAIAMANDAASRANALCPKKAAKAPAAPTVSLSASPAAIVQGKCATLTWSSANASSASIDQGVGSVGSSGSKQVCPGSTTQYTIAAVGEGGSRSASTTVTVTPPPPAPKVIDRLTLHVNFDFDKATIRSADTAELQKAIDFVKKYQGYKVSIEGHTDNIGSEQYNQRLSERRAAAVKEHLLKHGVADGARLKTKGYGKSKPIADNSTEKGRFENRRVEILILSE